MLVYLQTARFLTKTCWHPQWHTPQQCRNKSYTSIWQQNFQQNSLQTQRWGGSFAHLNVKVLVYKTFLLVWAAAVLGAADGSVSQPRWCSVKQTQSLLALQAPDLSGTAWLCHTQDHSTHSTGGAEDQTCTPDVFQGSGCWDLLAWEGLLPWDRLWAGTLGSTPISNDLLLKAPLAASHPQQIQHCALQDWSLALLWAGPAAEDEWESLTQKCTTDPNQDSSMETSSVFLLRGACPISPTGCIVTTVLRWRQEDASGAMIEKLYISVSK